jgi:hypothetical protein
MRLRSILIPLAFLLFLALVLPAVAHAAPAAPAPQAAAGASAAGAPASSAPALGDFLASLGRPAGAQAAASCGTSFCTQAQRDACNKQCQGHKVFVGLECCSSTCTTYCICGSRPIAC